jgi:AraC-like DNA-binding protein
MTSITTGTAYPLQSEAVGAASNNDDAHIAPERFGQAACPRASASRHQRERNKALLISRIKQAVADMVLTTGNNCRLKNSEYLSRKLCHDYTYLANVFSETTGSTLEHYIIALRIERVEELLRASPLSLTQIAGQLGYSSVAHLSNQFKKVTGQTPSAYKVLQTRHEIVLKSENDVTVFCNCVNASEVRRVSFAT